MNYDIFFVFSRADAAFVKSVAKGMERYHISVCYKESTPTGTLTDSIEKGS